MNGLRFLLLGLAVLVLAALGWRLTTAPRPEPQVARPIEAPQSNPSDRPHTAARPTATEARATLEAALRTAPDLSRAFEALRTQFPTIADHVLSAAAARLARSGETTPPDDLLADGVRELRQSSGVLAARAGPEALSAIFDTKAAILASLAQGDPRVCADFLFGGTSPEYADFAAGHRALEAQAALASVTATAEGRKLNIDRGVPTVDDFKSVENALVSKGLSSDEVAALLDGKSIDPPLPDARVCANARTYFNVLKGLPDEVRLRIYGTAAEALARS